jgi:tRNA uridine 5-carbamoylmethylation protein Kti12
MIYMPVACPGSGKSYVAEEMVKAGIITPWAVVSSDYYREVVSDNRQDMAATPDAFDLCNTIIRARLKRGLDVYMDGTNLNKKFRDKDLELYCGQWGHPLTILVSDAPRSLVERRNRERAWPVPQEAFDRFWTLSEAFEPDRYVDLYGAKVSKFTDQLGEAPQADINYVQEL